MASFRVLAPPRLDFHSSNPIFVRVVAIQCLQGQCAVRVAFPSAAQINRIVNSADLIIAADAKRDGVVFAVTHIRKPDLPQYGGVERARRAESVNTQSVVSAVFTRPFAMID